MTSTWVLAVDFGTTNTAAAVAEAGDRPRILQVDGAPTMPSALYLEEQEDQPTRWLTGRSAEASALIDPIRFAPTPKRNLGLETMSVGFQRVGTVEEISAIFTQVFRPGLR